MSVKKEINDVKEYMDESQWNNISEYKTITFPEFVTTADIRRQLDREEIKLKEEPAECDENAEDQRISHDTTNEFVKFTEDLDNIKNEVEIGDNRICYKDNLKVEYVKEVINDDVECKKKYECPKCKYETNRWHCLKEHLVVHSDVKPYECEVCKKRFRRFNNLKDHSFIHSEDMKFFCGHCDYKTYQKKYLLRHLKNKHRIRESKDYKCSLCDYETDEKRYLNEHFKRHLVGDSKEFKCSQCEYQTSVHRYLKAHERVKHGNVKEYVCSKCEYRTTIKCSMNQHLITHDDSRPYECNVCSKSFKRKYILVAHALVHSKERRFHCAHCDFKCNKKHGLERHLKSRHIK